MATLVKEKLFRQNEAELRSVAIKTRLDQTYCQLDKLEPIYATLRRIEALAKEQDLKGYRGILIDYIECKFP